MSSPGIVEQARMLSARDRVPRAEIEALQQARLEALVGHARERSAYYRERLSSASTAS